MPERTVMQMPRNLGAGDPSIPNTRSIDVERRARRARSAAGFTLIEIMVVVVILGILGALIVPNVIGRPDQAKVEAAKSDLRAISTALEMYRMDNSNYPSSDQGLDALVTQPSGYPEARRWNPDGYLQKLPKDPWDEPYLYVSEDNSYDIYTFARDRREGGEGYDTDLRYTDL